LLSAVVVFAAMVAVPVRHGIRGKCRRDAGARGRAGVVALPKFFRSKTFLFNARRVLMSEFQVHKVNTIQMNLLENNNVTECGAPLVIGHRGASAFAAENTVMAYLLAIMQGADGIEADIRMTADGELVAVHDPDLRRTGRRSLKVAHSHLEDLRAVDVGVTGPSGSRGQRVPTLDEVMGVLGSKHRLFLDIKGGVEMVPVLAAKLKKASVKPASGLLLTSEIEVARALRKALPRWPVCLLVERKEAGDGVLSPAIAQVIQVAKEVGAVALAMEAKTALRDERGLREIKRAGLGVHIFGVNRMPNARRCAALGVDSLITDYPGRLSLNLKPGRNGARSKK
jgi:glycerophosphoryl diester phosphodiesterase